MASSIEQICNAALLGASIRWRIGSIYEGSPEAKVCLEFYSQARDELLDAQDWSFNRRTAPLTKLKGPPPAGGYSNTNPWNDFTVPAPGWLYEYAYPSDCIDLRGITEMPGGMPDLDPVPQVWRVDNDPTPNLVGNPPTTAVGPEAKVIFTNVANAIGVYRSRVTDPGMFDPGFVTALISLLTERINRAFGDTVQQQQQDLTEAKLFEKHSDVRG